MEARKGIICGLRAYGLKPQLQKQPQIQLQPQQEAQEQGNDVVVITRTEFRCSQGYLIHIEEPEEDNEPIFRNMKNSARNSAPMTRPKQEQEQSS
ncbi:hypothetical protein Bca4012_018606 [Brassica carinata]|uniref:Uncharacterized protein n=1 Tax=Brassica carinata TaxID=52824 RepID=A0A8X7WL73_BRACI|nr:hypothetical protein Bca52824_002916 [Brassica carinata]